MSTKRCSNCGHPGFEDKAGYECRKCGFKNIASTALPIATLIYCEDCGHHWLDECGNNHPSTSWIVVTLSKKKDDKAGHKTKDEEDE
jgi:DNA-directed RNA polymerase subunit RPC12/RpoP